MPWPSTFTLEWRNRIHQRQSFLQVVSIGPGQAPRERDALSIANQMTLAPPLGAIRGIWTGLRSAEHGPDRAAVNNRSGPIDVAFAGEPIQEREVQQIPDSFRLPVAQTSPACHARTTAQFLRQHLPWYSAAQHEEDTGQAGAIRHTRASAARPRWWKRQKRFEKFPQRVGQQRGGHKPTLRRRSSAWFIEPVLLCALRALACASSRPTCAFSSRSSRSRSSRRRSTSLRRSSSAISAFRLITHSR